MKKKRSLRRKGPAGKKAFFKLGKRYKPDAPWSGSPLRSLSRGGLRR